MIAMKERFRSSEDITRDSSRTIKTVHVGQVLAKISPSVSKKVSYHNVLLLCLI